jgi:hypothetical protein
MMVSIDDVKDPSIADLLSERRRIGFEYQPAEPMTLSAHVIALAKARPGNDVERAAP